MTETKKISKPQLLEEPFVLAGLVPRGEKRSPMSRGIKRHKIPFTGISDTTPQHPPPNPNLPLFKLDLGLPSSLAFQSRVSEDVLVDNSFVQGDVHRVSGDNGGEVGSAHMLPGTSESPKSSWDTAVPGSDSIGAVRKSCPKVLMTALGNVQC